MRGPMDPRKRARGRLEAEIGAVRKERGGRLRIALCYANTYHVGMSNLGLQTLYGLLNDRRDVVCERAFHPDPEDLRDLQRRRLPLTSMETQTPLGEFEVIAFSISFELDLLKAARMLALSGIPARAAQRDAHHPLVIAGGAAPTINPEPLAAIADAIAIGEGEMMLAPLVEALKAGNKQAALRQLSAVPGAYVPSYYEARYDDGVQALLAGNAPGQIPRAVTPDLDAWPTHSRVLTDETEFGHMFLMEISRGCGRGCSFCAADRIYRPVRLRSRQALLETARAGLKVREMVGLIAAAVSDYPHVDELCQGILAEGGRVAVASLRADSATPELVDALAASKVQTITLAPEAATERLRRAVHKFIRDEDYLRTARLAAERGIRRLRLYFIVGLPTETEDDVHAIPAFVRALRKESGMGRVTVSAGPFVPKPHTPLERAPMLPVAEARRRMGIIRRGLAGEPWAEISLESANEAFIQAVLSRGDRRVGEVACRVAETRGGFGDWLAAFREEGLDPEGFALRERPHDEPLPWGHVG